MFALGSFLLMKMVTNHPRKPKTCLEERGKESRELENPSVGNLKIFVEDFKTHLELLAQTTKGFNGTEHTWHWQGTDRAHWQQDKRTKIHMQQGWTHLGNHNRVWLGCNIKGRGLHNNTTCFFSLFLTTGDLNTNGHITGVLLNRNETHLIFSKRLAEEQLSGPHYFHFRLNPPLLTLNLLV